MRQAQEVAVAPTRPDVSITEWLLPSVVLPLSQRLGQPSIHRQTQSYCQSADVDKAGQSHHIRKASSSFLLFVLLKNMKENFCLSLTKLNSYASIFCLSS